MAMMTKQLRQIYKISGKNVKWLPIIEAFEYYQNDDMMIFENNHNDFKVSINVLELLVFLEDIINDEISTKK